MKKKIVVACCAFLLVCSVVFFVYQNIFGDLEYSVNSYEYQQLSETLILIEDYYYYQDYNISEKEFEKMKQNSDNYYWVLFSGDLSNKNSDTIYYWEIDDVNEISKKKYWIDEDNIADSGAEIEGNSTRYAAITVIIECSESEIQDVCDEIINSQPFGAKGLRYIGPTFTET